MNPNRQKEEFSNAFVQAVSAAAGYSATQPSVDNDSIDWTLAQRGGDGNVRSPKLDVQLKATSMIDLDEEDESFTFSVSLKNYDDLRAENLLVPRIIVVALLPEDVSEWLEVSREQLLLRNCAYWTSVRGEPSSENETEQSISLSTADKFEPESLRDMMQIIEDGGAP